MNGQVTLKVKFGSDIRKAVLPSSEIKTYGELTSWITETYNLDAANLLLKYMDGDGDLVTMVNDEDLHRAISTEPLLYVHVFAGGESANAVVSQIFKEFDRLKHTMDNLKILIEDNAPYLSHSRYSRPSSPNKTDNVATIQPSVHEEIDHNGVARIVSSEVKEEPSDVFSQHEDSQHMENIPIDQHSSHSPHPQHHQQPPQQQHQPPQFPPKSGTPQHFSPQQNSGFVLPPQHHQAHQQPPQFPPQSATPQHFAPPPMNGAPPSQQPPQHQQPPQFPPQQSATPQHFAPPPSQQHPASQHQQPPQFPPQSATPQHFAPPPMNGAPQSQQPPQHQQPPQFPPQQSATPQHFAPPPSSGFAPPTSGFAPPSSGFAPPISGYPAAAKPFPGQQQPPSQAGPGVAPIGPPPTNFAGGPPPMGPAGLANPFARPQMTPQARPGNPGNFNNY